MDCENEVVLDFFSASASTAEAVVNQNVIDSKNRKLIMVQLPEPTPEKSIALKNGFTDLEKTNSVQTLKRFGITEIKSI